MSLFGNNTTVTQDELAPPSFEPTPSAQYRGTFTNPEQRSNDNGWEGISFSTVLLGTPEGEDTYKGVSVAGRTVRGIISTKTGEKRKNGKAYTPEEIAESDTRNAQTVGRLLNALGVATVDDDGNVDLSAINSTEDVFELLQAADGTDYLPYVKTGPRKRGGEVQTKDDGEPWIDSEVKGFQPLAG